MKLTLLIIAIVLVILFSWFVSLKAKRYHGIPRFFVFLGIILLIYTNSSSWFSNPIVPRQIISWVLLSTSLIIAVMSIYQYFRHAQPSDRFENSTVIVRTGLYKYIRHPMYYSLLLFGYGAFLKDISSYSRGLAIMVLIGVLLTNRVEESEMIVRFGGEYEKYMSATEVNWKVALWTATLLTAVTSIWL